MSKATEESMDWQQDPMKSPIIQHIAKHVLCRNVNTMQHYEAIFLMDVDESDFDKLKEALFYLEYAGWNVEEARFQRELDEVDRAGPVMDADGNEVDNIAANPGLDRVHAKKGVTYDHALCQIQVVVNDNLRTFSYPDASTLNHNDQKDIDKLNRWRHGIFRKYVGRQKYNKPAGKEFHSLEVDYLLNRYAEQEIDDRGRGNYEEIVCDFNAVFEGVNLPGRYEPCDARTKNSITGQITRKAIKPTLCPPHYSGVMKHEAAQERIKQEWQERYNANEERVLLPVANVVDDDVNTYDAEDEMEQALELGEAESEGLDADDEDDLDDQADYQEEQEMSSE